MEVSIMFRELIAIVIALVAIERVGSCAIVSIKHTILRNEPLILTMIEARIGQAGSFEQTSVNLKLQGQLRRIRRNNIPSAQYFAFNNDKTICAFNYRTATHTSFVCYIFTSVNGNIRIVPDVGGTLYKQLHLLHNIDENSISLREIQRDKLLLEYDPLTIDPGDAFSFTASVTSEGSL